MEFSKEQQESFDKYIQGENIFITGPGGTGKTALIRSIYAHAIAHQKNIQVCALTGCASILLECRAKTIHSWSGVGLCQGHTETIVKKVVSNRYKNKPWKRVDVLVIDEISMMSMKLFDTLNQIGKLTRRNFKNPFGGIQIIFSGDFYQLPPIKTSEDQDANKFCFESEDWKTIFPPQSCIQLVKVFRQNDEKYISILNQIREGRLKRSSIDTLNGYINRSKPSIQPTKLYPTRIQVDHINNQEMNNLLTEEYQFHIQKQYDLPIMDKRKPTRISFTKEDVEKELKQIENSILCEETLKLKVGTHVMCIINTDVYIYPLCNGSQGIVRSFIDGLPNVEFTQLNRTFQCVIRPHIWTSENIEGIGISQIPLIHSWALTIHKSQGMTLDIAEIDAGNGIFECGQTYVALSRIKSLDGLYLTSFNYEKIKINRKVKEFYETTFTKDHTLLQVTIPITTTSIPTQINKFSYFENKLSSELESDI